LELIIIIILIQQEEREFDVIIADGNREWCAPGSECVGGIIGSNGFVMDTTIFGVSIGTVCFAQLIW
jgi:hypothetical protein